MEGREISKNNGEQKKKGLIVPAVIHSPQNQALNPGIADRKEQATHRGLRQMEERKGNATTA